MKLYRSDATALKSSRKWAGTQDEANKLWGRGHWSREDVPTDSKPAMIAWLNANGPPSDSELEPVEAPPPATIPEPSYASSSIALEDAWEALPLARKLHFAALALEDARDLIKP